MKLLRFHSQGLYFRGGMTNLQEFRGFFLFLSFLLSLLQSSVSFARRDAFRYCEKDCKNAGKPPAKTVRDTGQKKDIHPCPNEDHTATNIPHANILRHLITKLRVNHGGDYKAYPFTPTTPFTYLSVLIWADSKDSWINHHTHIHAPMAGPGLPHALMMMSESRAKHTGWLAPVDFISKDSLSLFSLNGPPFLSCAHTLLAYLRFFLPLVSFLPFLLSSSHLLLPLPSVLMHWDTNEVGLCQANMTPHPNQPWTGGRQEPQPPLHYVLHLYLPPSHSSCSLLSLPSSNILPVGYFSKTGIS